MVFLRYHAFSDARSFFSVQNGAKNTVSLKKMAKKSVLREKGLVLCPVDNTTCLL